MDRQACRSHLPKFIISKGRNAPRGRGRLGGQIQDLRLGEFFSACSRRFPTDLCDLFVVFLFVRGLLVLGDGFNFPQEGGSEGGRVCTLGCYSGPKRIQNPGVFPPSSTTVFESHRMSPHLVYKILVLHKHKGIMETDRLTNFIHGIVAARFDRHIVNVARS